jgi:chromosome segregation ATPase
VTSAANTQANDLAQALHTLSWLDEEHRKDRAEIARLQQRLEGQATEISEQARKLQEMESRLASLQAQQARMPEFSRSTELLKKELVSMIENVEEERHRAEREATRLRLADVEAQSRALAELRKRIEILPELMDRLETRFVEDRRLSQELVALREKMVDVDKAISEWPRRSAYLEEQRLQDGKRIAQLQQEVSELFKRLEPYPGRFELLDEQLRRAAAGIAELRAALPALAEKISQSNERYLKDRSEDVRQMASWAQTLQEFQQQMERYAKEMRLFREAHDAATRTLEGLSQLEERLVRESKQVAEVQRMAEERQKHELEKWQEQNEKRWARHEMDSSRIVAELQNHDEAADARINNLLASLEALQPEIERLWKTMEEEAEALVTEAQERLALVSRQREGQRSA